MTPLPTDLALRLKAVLGRRAPATLTEEGAQRAAVSAVITTETDPALLLVKRRERTGDPWSGHAALPGGFAASVDASLVDTAEREAEEETGLDLQAVGTRLGQLDDVFPRSIYLPRVIVTPFLHSVSERLPVAPSSELDAALWVSLSEVLDPASRGQLVISRGGQQMEFEAIHVGGLVVWGLTERILSRLGDLIAGL